MTAAEKILEALKLVIGKDVNEFAIPVINTIIKAHESEEKVSLREEIEILKKEREWIPVSERLPEDGQLVLIQSTDNAAFPVVSRYRKSHQMQFIIPYRSDLNVTSVTHWQPLPPKP